MGSTLPDTPEPESRLTANQREAAAQKNRRQTESLNKRLATKTHLQHWSSCACLNQLQELLKLLCPWRQRDEEGTVHPILWVCKSQALPYAYGLQLTSTSKRRRIGNALKSRLKAGAEQTIGKLEIFG
jgi:hypothetical protein